MFVTAPTPIGTIAFTQWTMCKISASTHKKIHKIQKKSSIFSYIAKVSLLLN